MIVEIMHRVSIAWNRHGFLQACVRHFLPVSWMYLIKNKLKVRMYVFEASM